MTPAKILRFSSFRLDLLNQQLWEDEEPIRLRPKTFAVLRYLAERPGRLVTREELVTAVWPNTRGAEIAPKRCILELRQALGERADAPRLIETVGRIGYRFSAPLADHASDARAVEAHTAQATLVGREVELSRLERHLSRSSAEPASGRLRHR